MRSKANDIEYTIQDRNFEFLIPVEICRHSIANRFVSPTQLYLYLKGSCSGKMKLPPSFIKQIADDFNWTVRTVQNNIKKLLSENWIGFNPKSRYYFIRGFDRITQLEKFNGRSAVFFCKQYFENFKGFVAAACIGYIINSIKRKERGADRNKRRSNHAPQLSGFRKCSCSLIGKLIKISQSTACEMKKAALKSGLIEVEKSFQKTHVNRLEKNFFKKSFPELAGRVRIKHGDLVLVETDMIRPLLKFKRRKKAE